MDFTLTATKECYQDYSSTISISPGQTITHDVYMNPILNSLWGKIIDKVTGNPIAGATVSLNGFSTTTNSSGDFIFTDFFIETSGKTLTLNITLQNYEDISIQETLNCGDQTDVGILEMQPILSVLEGVVIDANTSQPISGVNLTLDGYTTISDNDGRFRFENIRAF